MASSDGDEEPLKVTNKLSCNEGRKGKVSLTTVGHPFVSGQCTANSGGLAGPT